MRQTFSKAKGLQVQTWLNTDNRILLSDLHGKVIVVVAFQMLCPGCVSYALPQAKKVSTLFRREDVVVLGLHTVFEHHEANSKQTLEAFLHENRITFPVGIDMPADDNSRFPKTMKTYHMEGTPTLLLIDKKGNLRKQKLGHLDDVVLGAEIMSLMLESEEQPTEQEG